jgi:hypothetical protein
MDSPYLECGLLGYDTVTRHGVMTQKTTTELHCCDNLKSRVWLLIFSAGFSMYVINTFHFLSLKKNITFKAEIYILTCMRLFLEELILSESEMTDRQYSITEILLKTNLNFFPFQLMDCFNNK